MHMRRTILTALLAATVMPVAAQAQSQGEIRHDRRDLREERRDLNRAYRSGDPRAIGDERDDVRDARQELREDINDRNRRWARDDWRRYRERNAVLYRRGDWRAPFRYHDFRAGARIGGIYYDRRYVIVDPWRYHLPAPRPYERWIRHYDDVLLVDVRRGYVVDVIHGFYR